MDNVYEEETQAWDWLHDFILTGKGFRKIRSPKSGAGFPSEVTYSSMFLLSATRDAKAAKRHGVFGSSSSSSRGAGGPVNGSG